MCSVGNEIINPLLTESQKPKQQGPDRHASNHICSVPCEARLPTSGSKSFARASAYSLKLALTFAEPQEPEGNQPPALSVARAGN